jgi:hypothetical protein
MQSEIPQLQVITAISEADTEDYVSQLLFSQGWSIIFRAFDFAALENFLSERGDTLRTVIIYKSDLPGFNPDSFAELATATTTLIPIDTIPINSHLLMSHIRSQLRLPLIVNSPKSLISGEPVRQLATKQTHITITGTTGAPGRSNFAINLGNYLSAQNSVRLIDADLRAPAIEYLYGRSENPSQGLEVVNLDSATKPISLPKSGGPRITITDLGALPPIDEVLTDRRWQANLINQILEQTTTLIYMCKSSGLSLIRLEAFISQLPTFLHEIPIIYLLNQSGNSREDRALERHFRSMVAGESHFILPIESRITTNFSTPTKRGSAFTKEIGKITTVIK